MTFSGDGLFERHLDLRPLRCRRSGLVRCPFHEDRRPSFSVDLSRGLFNCFGCGTKGGLRKFAGLVGEDVRGPHFRAGQNRQSPRDWRQIAAEQLRRERKRNEMGRALWIANDYVRRCRRGAEQARRLATQMGPDDPRAWSLLERAAQVDRDGLRVEAEVDAILEGGRVA